MLGATESILRIQAQNKAIKKSINNAKKREQQQQQQQQQ
jgi:hypothetical protein